MRARLLTVEREGGYFSRMPLHNGILAPFKASERFRMVELSVFDTRYYFRLRDYVGSVRRGGKTQQLAGVVERDGDVGHDGRTCGRTGAPMH